MARELCRDCPFGDNPPEGLNKKECIIPIIMQDLTNGILQGAHACHMLNPDKWVPDNPEEECVGCRRYFRI